MSSKSSARASKAEAPAAKPAPKLKWRYTAIRHDAGFDVPLCGIDEVGRAPLAGPVVAGCVYIAPERAEHKIWKYIRDSKELSLEEREAMFEDIAGNCCHGFGEASVEEIERLNIHYASLLAMERAYAAMIECMEYKMTDMLALVDGRFAPKISCQTKTIIGGDNVSVRIGAAAILAKVHRDRMMFQLHESHPQYGWNSNVGYPTPHHRKAIKEHGLTIHHRRSFGACRQPELPLEGQAA